MRKSGVRGESFKPDVFLLVLVGDSNVSAIGDQVKSGDLSKLLLVDRESHVQNISDIIVPGNGKKERKTQNER